MARINIELGEALHKAFRKKLIDENVGMAKAVNQAIAEWVERRETTKRGEAK